MPRLTDSYRSGIFAYASVLAMQRSYTHDTLTRLGYDDINDSLLAGLDISQLSLLTVSFVRVDGDKPLMGQAIDIGEVRIELSTEKIRS